MIRSRSPRPTSKLIADWRADIDSYEKDPKVFFDTARPAAIDINARWIAFGASQCGERLTG
jgi:hypothetical protein